MSKNEAPSIISKTMELQGDIRSPGIIEIEGRILGLVEGNIVVIRETGYVEGKICVDSLNIYGSFKGDIRANNINIYKKGKIVGNIEYKSISIEDGAYIDGQFKKITGEICKDSKVANENFVENQKSDKI